MEIDPVHAKFGNLIDHMITEPEKVNYFKLTCAGEQLTEGDFKKAEEMKKAFMRDEFASRILPLSDTQKVMINPCQKFDYDIHFYTARPMQMGLVDAVNGMGRRYKKYLRDDTGTI